MSAQCPPPPPIPPNELESQAASGLATVMKAMGVESCKTSQLGGISLLPPFFVGGTASVGCEQLSAQANAVQTAMQQTACILNIQNISSSTILNNNNTVNLIIGPGASVCDINISQSIQGTVRAANSFST